MKKRISLKTTLFFLVILCLAGCGNEGEDEGPCGSGKATFEIGVDDVCCPSPVFIQYVAGDALDPDALYYYYYTSGVTQRVVFFFGTTVDQICAEEHLQLLFSYSLEPGSVELPIPLKIYGEAYLSTLFKDEIILATNEQTPGHSVTDAPLAVGLKQIFGDGAATVDVYINVEFDSLGDLVSDQLYLTDHVTTMSAFAEYSKF